MEALKLSEDQQSAYDAFVGFLLNSEEIVFVLSGYAGTGKSTLVTYLLNSLNDLVKTTNLLTEKDTDWEIKLTATTNKAAQALQEITGYEVTTVQSALGLIVKKDYTTGQSNLIVKQSAAVLERTILFIDEASFADRRLMQLIFQQTKNCKLVFIGDPAQLAPVNSKGTPVFDQGFREAKLTQVMRQAAGNPIIDLATMFRNVVNGADWQQFHPDGHFITHMPREAYDKAIADEFAREDWVYHDSKVLAWRNATVIKYNKAINNLSQGNPELAVGDYAVVNSFVQLSSRNKLSTDQLVSISSINTATDCGLPGKLYVVDGLTAFMPDDWAKAREMAKQARSDGDFELVKTIEDTWVDLRAAYACTVNKSQGSTYKKVFVDLDDIFACRQPETIARLLYVAVSRASEQVIMTGDAV